MINYLPISHKYTQVVSTLWYESGGTINILMPLHLIAYSSPRYVVQSTWGIDDDPPPWRAFRFDDTE